MADSKEPPKDERVEELLSQLQGIFGKLSRAEEEESRQKVEVSPTAVPEVVPTPEPSIEAAPPTAPNPEPPPAPPPIDEPPPASEPHPPPIDPFLSMPAEEPPAAPPPVLEVPDHVFVAPPPAEAPPDLVPEVAASTGGDDAPNELGATIFFPVGRENEAKTLAKSLEAMAPKFTKVTFRLRIRAVQPYEPKSDWRESILAQTSAVGSRVVCFVTERPLEEAKRRVIATELENRAVYFQEVPLLSIEKRAFYTDFLLGLVFFVDSLRPNPPE